MFKKKLSKKSSRSSQVEASPLDDAFWHWYSDSFHRIEIKTGDPIPFNPKKYHHNSKEVYTIKKYFEKRRLQIPLDHEIIALLKSPFTQGDLKKTCCLIRFFQLSGQGLFLTNKDYDRFGNKIQFLGAENWGNVMCYLDTLMFAMFANLESFEPILFVSNQHDNFLVNQLATLLRLYVSLLRSGNLITTDITIRICEILSKLGFKEAMSGKQQDSSVLFEFLTEILSMPLLTFKIDIKHGGKYNKDDDLKYSKERILFVSIPDEEDEIESPEKSDEVHHESEGNSSSEHEVLLEECLEHYFNNSINVKRELERRATLQSITKDTLPGGEISCALPEVNEMHQEGDVTTTNPSTARDDETLTPTIASRSSLGKTTTKYSIRARSSTLSIWSLNENESDGKPKEVSLPAWMFLRLLPFYTDENNIMDNENESIARNSKEFINRRPILPICLKRYSFDRENSKANRSLKRIIIPPVINLPQFVEDDSNDDIAGNFKLILESAICHRGTSISSGHFHAVARKDKRDLDESDEAYEAIWYLYDDMRKDSRVVEKTFREIFSVEWPYMLFYRLVSNNEAYRSEDYNSSPGASFNYSSKPAKPFIISEGSNNKFWVDNALSPVISNVELSSEGEDEFEEEDEVSMRINSDISLYDSNIVDIRNKYYWYITDKDRNYYKEYPDLTKVGTGESAVSISPQFRRNSQWSEKSSTYTQLLNEAQNPPSVASDLNYNISLNSSQNSLSALKKSLKLIKTNTGIDAEKQNETGSERKNSPIAVNHSIDLKQGNIASNETLKQKEAIANSTTKKEKKHEKHEKHSNRRHKLKREKYKKEKCILM